MIREYLVTNSNRFISQWLILAIDLAFTVFTVPLSFFILHNLDSQSIRFERIWILAASAIFAYGAGYFFSGSFRGVIRHTSTDDALRVAFGTVLGFVLLIVFNLIVTAQQLVVVSTLPYTLLTLHFLTTLLMILLFRVMIKLAYFRLISSNLGRDFAVIYGASMRGILAKNALIGDNDSSTKVVAFIDDNQSLCNKTIEGIPVFHSSDFTPSFIKKRKISSAIIALENYERTDSINKWVDICLNNDVVVKRIPPVNQWIDGRIRRSQIKHINIEDLLQRKPIRFTNKYLKEGFQGKRVLITGAAGSIGSEIVKQVLINGASAVILLDQAETPMHELLLELRKMGHVNGSVRDYIVDIVRKNRLRDIFEFERPDLVFHASAYKHVPLMEDHPVEAVEVNVLGTKNVADLSDEYGVEKFVLVSTDKAVRPTSVMGSTKRIAELYIQYLDSRSTTRTRFLTTRFGNVLGSNGSVIPNFKNQIQSGGPVTVTHRDITRYFMTIPEACHLVLEAGIMGHGGEIFIFDMGKPVKIVDLAEKMILLSGLRPHIDIPIEFVGLRPGEKLFEELWVGNETMLPTHHDQIMIAEDRPAVEDVNNEIAKILNNLEKISKKDLRTVILSMAKNSFDNYVDASS